MDISILETGNAKAALPTPHFPVPFQAVIWRNWGMVPRERLAKALKTDIATLDRQAALLGLTPDDSMCDTWLERGYQTIIRQNWHLVDYEQLLTLLDWTPEKLLFILREDDFLWIKLGSQKPIVEPPTVKPLSPAQEAETKALVAFLAQCDPSPVRKEKPFEFIEAIRPCGAAANSAPGLRMVYSFSAPYGDPLLNPALDPFPDNHLDAYAAAGVNALFLPGILYALVPWLGEDNPLSDGWQTRIETLRDLCRRMKKRGIKLILYINEPRALPESFFADRPDWKGVKASSSNIYSLCTSNPEVLAALKNAMARLFTMVPELGGIFCITMSENLTNCWSKSSVEHPPACPRCAPRGPAAVVADVLKAFVEGARMGNPDAEIYAWSWAWAPPWDETLIAGLPEGVKLLCVSETRLPTAVGGYEGTISDYSISKPGPGPISRKNWKLAREHGIELGAKVQINNTWEMSAVPYIPVPGLVEEHLTHLRNLGVTNFMLSWTLGGYPGGNLRLLTKTSRQLAQEDFGAAADMVQAAYSCFDEGFRHFPFNGTSTIYVAPQNYGPVDLLYLEPTGYRATMIGFPYDDLTGWRGNYYPEEVFEQEFQFLCDQWATGLACLEQAKGMITEAKQAAFDDLWSVANAAYCHFRSTLLQIRFVRLRNAGKKAELAAVVKEEQELVLRQLKLMRLDSRLAFEASNHYYYTEQTLKEKLLNCRWVLQQLQ